MQRQQECHDRPILNVATKMNVRLRNAYEGAGRPQLIIDRAVIPQPEHASGAAVGCHRRHFFAASQGGAEDFAVVEHPKHAVDRISFRIRNVRRRPAYLLQPKEIGTRLDLLELLEAFERPHYLNPSKVRSFLNTIDLREAVVAVLRFPQVARKRIDRHAEPVANAKRKYLLQIGRSEEHTSELQ